MYDHVCDVTLRCLFVLLHTQLCRRLLNSFFLACVLTTDVIWAPACSDADVRIRPGNVGLRNQPVSRPRRLPGQAARQCH